MKKRCLLLAALMLLLTALTACAAGNAGGDMVAMEPSAPAMNGNSSAMDFTYWGETEMPDMDFPVQEAAPMETGAGNAIYTGESAKLIQRAELQLQTTDFPAAEASLNALVEAQGGYFENSSVQGGGYYDQQAARYGSYVIRVPKERYEAFLSAAGELCHVVSLNRSAEDVGEAYFDLETRLRTQQTKRDRLQSLLEQAENMQDIISLENALSDTDYQIEMYSTDLRRYDSLVDFATVTVYLDEVRQLSDLTGPADSLDVRMASALSEGLDGAKENWLNFLVWCAYHLIGLITAAVIIVAAVLILVRLRKKKRGLGVPPSGSDGGGSQS